MTSFFCFNWIVKAEFCICLCQLQKFEIFQPLNRSELNDEPPTSSLNWKIRKSQQFENNTNESEMTKILFFVTRKLIKFAKICPRYNLTTFFKTRIKIISIWTNWFYLLTYKSQLDLHQFVTPIRKFSYIAEGSIPSNLDNMKNFKNMAKFLETIISLPRSARDAFRYLRGLPNC